MDQPKMSPTEIASFIQLALKLLDAVKESGLLKKQARGRRSAGAGTPAARKAAAERMRAYRASKAAQAAAPKAPAKKKKVRKATPKAANPLANVPTTTEAAAG